MTEQPPRQPMTGEQTHSLIMRGLHLAAAFILAWAVLDHWSTLAKLHERELNVCVTNGGSWMNGGCVK